MKKTALPMIVILIFAGLVGYSAFRYHTTTNVYVAPEKKPGMYVLAGVEVEKHTQVMVAVHVDKDGKVTEDSLVRSCGDPVVDADALKRALRFKFEPARMGKRPIDAWISVPVNYYPKPDTTTHAYGTP